MNVMYVCKCARSSWQAVGMVHYVERARMRESVGFIYRRAYSLLSRTYHREREREREREDVFPRYSAVELS